MGKDYAALRQQTLELARGGMLPHTIARELGISGHTTSKWIKEAGIITGRDALYTDKRREVVELAWRGYTAAAIARIVGGSERSVRTWMKEAGFNTSWDADCSFPCPDCNGRMQKQELFFWKCPCGAEWWPSERVVPEDPDEWTPATRLTVDPPVVALIRQLLDEGRSYPEIATALNMAGHKPAKGPAWTRGALKQFIKKHDLKGDYQGQRGQAEDICKTMALGGYNCQQIADRLNAAGHKTRQGQQWSRKNVRQLLHVLLPELKTKIGRPGLRVKLSERLKNEVHPWKMDEEVRIKKLKARREHALHNVPSGHDA